MFDIDRPMKRRRRNWKRRSGGRTRKRRSKKEKGKEKQKEKQKEKEKEKERKKEEKKRTSAVSGVFLATSTTIENIDIQRHTEQTEMFFIVLKAA